MTLSNSPLIKVLSGIGFTEHEALLYLTCLELGPSSIWDISQASGIKRPTCYVILEGLAKKNLASSSNDGRRIVYSVVAPKNILALLEQNYSTFTDSLTELAALASQTPVKPTVTFYEGIEGIKKVYNLTLSLPQGQQILVYTSDSATPPGYGSFVHEYITNRIHNKIGIRIIYSDKAHNHRLDLQDASKLRQARFLPADKYNPTLETLIAGDSIAHIAHSSKAPFATVIESEPLAREEQQRFELLWSLAKS